MVNRSCGTVFDAHDPGALVRSLSWITSDAERLRQMGRAAAERAWAFDIGKTEASLVGAVERVCRR